MADMNRWDIDKSPIALLRLLRVILNLPVLGFSDADEVGRALLAWSFELSRTEIQILGHLTAGLTDAEIAEQMDFAEVDTVKNHLKSIYQKMHVRNRTRAAAIAVVHGLGH
jgi:DNA-binding NarL/FixJ family response regulator